MVDKMEVEETTEEHEKSIEVEDTKYEECIDKTPDVSNMSLREFRNYIIGLGTYDYGFARLTAAELFEKEYPEHFLKFLEIDLLVQYGKYDQARTILQANRQESFEFGLLLYLCDRLVSNEEARQLYAFSRVYSGKAEGVVDLVQRASVAHPDRKLDLFILLTTMRIDTCRTTWPHIYGALKDGQRPTGGVSILSYYLILSSFRGLLPDDMFLLCDLVTPITFNQSKYIKFDNQNELDKGYYSECLLFVKKSYPLFYAIMSKLGAAFLPQKFRLRNFITQNCPKLANSITTVQQRCIMYMLASVLLRVPNTIKDGLYIPFLTQLLMKKELEDIEPKKMKHAFMIPFKDMHTVMRFFDYKSELFLTAAKEIGYTRVMHTCFLVMFFREEYDKCLEFKELLSQQEDLPETFKNNGLPIMELLCIYLKGQKKEALQKAIQIIEKLAKAGLEDMDVEHFEGKLATPHFITDNMIPMVMINLMNRILFECEIDSVVVYECLILMSQINFARHGFLYYNHAEQNLKQKGLADAENLLEYIYEPAVTQRYIYLLNSKTSDPLDKSMLQLILDGRQREPSTTEIVKRLVPFIQKHKDTLINLVPEIVEKVI